MKYPLHLGVTEAGDGMEGRIKSSIGIGTLLEDGIGDTIRVSLTEEPEFEIPVANNIIERYNDKKYKETKLKISDIPINPYVYLKRISDDRFSVGKDNVPIVISDLSSIKDIDYNILSNIGYQYTLSNDKWTIGDLAPDYIFTDKVDLSINLPLQLKILSNYSIWAKNKDNKSVIPVLDSDQYLKTEISNKKFIYLTSCDVMNLELLKKINNDINAVIILECSGKIQEQRNFFFNLLIHSIKVPVVLSFNSEVNFNNKLINSSISMGGILIDGFGDGVFLKNKNSNEIKNINELSFNILQATRSRISKTEFISCPSCGRTQFDLQTTTDMVRKETSHLKGLKIAVMGCIVNGPGEMADADYGYVGTGRDKISLYKGHKLIKSHIDSKDSIKELINLIKSNNDWIEPN